MPEDRGRAPPTPCLFCGEPERVEIAEIWGHEFMIETCCERLHEAVVRDMADDPEWAKTLLRRIGMEELTGNRLRRLADDGCCGLVLDWQLRIGPVTRPIARTFVGRHHQHCPPPVTWRFEAAAFNGATMIGVVLVGNPVARALGGRGTLEVNRLCIRRDVPRALAWNAASMLYGWAAREAGQRGWGKIITYTRADEEGRSLVAAGWVKEASVRGRGWHGGDRRRSNTNAFIDKVRWSKTLKKPRRNKQADAPKMPDGVPAPPWWLAA